MKLKVLNDYDGTIKYVVTDKEGMPRVAFTENEVRQLYELLKAEFGGVC